MSSEVMQIKWSNCCYQIVPHILGDTASVSPP
jgi:hypothetical protein